nr:MULTISPECIES: ABC transporter substrate-binding protein [unclassified Bradyrhizobium]
MGLASAQNLQLVTAFYWDRDAESRAWANKFFEKYGRMPTMTQAGVYSAVRHYLRAVQAANSEDGLAVAAKIRELPVADAFAHGTVPRRWSVRARHVSGARQDAGGVEPAVGLLRHRRDDSRSASVPPLSEGGCELASQ